MSQVQRDSSHAALARWRRAGWYRALTLAERAASLHGTTTAPAQGGVWANKQAEQTLQQWKAQAPFQAGTAFADYLAMEGLTEHDLLQLLAEPLEALQARLPLPEWVNTLLRAMEEPASTAAVPVLEADPRTPVAFLPLLQPLLASAQQRLCLGLEDLAWHYRHLPFEAQPVRSSLVVELARRLLFQASRTIALELKVTGLLGQLRGQTPQERFHHFLQRTSQREALLTLFEEYSVLARQLVLTCDHWVASSLEVLRRLCADWDEIRATFSPESDPGLLIEVQSGAGDLHREGRSVLLLKFRSGFQAVYKPKSLAIDVHFQELLQWLNQHGAEPPFQTVNVIDKGTYGWSAWVQARDCTSQEEVQRFYERQGAYLALLNVSEATDFHYENLIAAGEYPILIDLETLFHPRIAGEDTLFAGALAHEALAHSVYQIGLLPQRSWGTDEAEGVNMSGLGGPEGQLTPRAVPRWEAAGTDQMRLERRRVELPAARNLPRLNGQQIEALDYRGALMAGFKQMYALLQDQRDALVAQWLPRFAQDEIRFIARPTDIYARFLYDSFRPELLRDALERERHFDRLWLGIQWQPSMSRLIPAERADLLRGDVPFFTTRPDSRDLYTSRGEIIPEFFPQSSLNVVRKRLKCLSSSDLTRQLWIINAAFTVSALNTQGLPRKPLHLESSPGVPHTPLLRGAQTFGELLARNALWSANAVGWLGVSPKNEQEWELLPAGLDLYNGLPGISLFLAYLERLTGDQHALDLAQATLSSIQTLLRHPHHQQTLEGIGAFDGWGGVLYLYSHLGRLWKKPALFQEAEVIVERLADLIEQDHSYDIIAGSAGCICALLSLYAVAPSPHTLKAAIHCGDHLVATAQPMKAGIGWIIPHQERPLTGFAHGNAGIALSLLRLAAVSGEERFKEAARSALAYERSLYAPAQHNWPDLRKLRASSRRTQVEEAETQRFMVAWCHGAAGIALARLASAAYLDDALLHEEIAAALRTTLDQGFWVRHNLCHGGFGNLETLLVASRTGEWPDLQQRVQQIAGALLESLGSADQPNDGVLDIASPGLMTGGAGVGYQLLRLAAPERVPSVLLLEPPWAFV